MSIDQSYVEDLESDNEIIKDELQVARSDIEDLKDTIDNLKSDLGEMNDNIDEANREFRFIDDIRVCMQKAWRDILNNNPDIKDDSDVVDMDSFMDKLMGVDLSEFDT